jgi:phosphoglycolate phosphatase
MAAVGAPRGRVRGVLLDKDGTLLDFRRTWAPISRACAGAAAALVRADPHALLRACGHDPATDTFRPGSTMVVGSARDVARGWLPLLPGVDEEALVELIDGTFTRMSAAAAVPVDGLHAAVGDLRARGLALGVATSDNEASARRALQRLGLLGDFPYVCGYDSGHGPKPGPGMVLGFCAALRLAPSEVVVVGDSAHDLEMAHAAGAALRVGVLTGPATADDLAPLADAVISGVAALPALLDALVELPAPVRAARG